MWPKLTVSRNHLFSPQFGLSSIAFDLHLGLVLFPGFESLTINITFYENALYLLPGVLKCAFIYIFSLLVLLRRTSTSLWFNGF